MQASFILSRTQSSGLQGYPAGDLQNWDLHAHILWFELPQYPTIGRKERRVKEFREQCVLCS